MTIANHNVLIIFHTEDAVQIRSCMEPGAVPFTRRTTTVTRNLSIMVVNNEFSKREVQERLATALNQARVALWFQLDETPGMSPYAAGQELENF